MVSQELFSVQCNLSYQLCNTSGGFISTATFLYARLIHTPIFVSRHIGFYPSMRYNIPVNVLKM